MSDEIKQENEEQEHDVEAHRKHHHNNLNEEPVEKGEDSDDAVEAHMKHHHNN